jgi:hypothetical protein
MLELMVVLGISMVVMAMGIPMMGTTLGAYRLSGDVHSLSNAVYLTKLRAAADFSKTRLYVDLSTNGFHIESWQKGAPGSWVTEGGVTYLSSGSESYGFGVVTTPPANTQGAIGQAAPCLTAAGGAIGNTACIVFNSRGIPVTDAAGTTGGPTNAHALYVMDSTSVFGITVSATGVIQVWRTNPTATPNWSLQ